MKDPITIGGLLSVLFGAAALICTGFGALALFASGMSDAPEDDAGGATVGCVAITIGGGLLLLAILFA